MLFFKNKNKQGSNQHVTIYQANRRKTWREISFKVIKIQLILLSVVLNVWFARQLFVVTCSAGGHFMTQAKCDELYTNKFDSNELARLRTIQQNPDLFNN